MKIKTENVIECSDWDEFVKKTYGKPYCFQQQNNCQSRGIFRLTVPNKNARDFENDTVPEIVNHEEMGVSFAAWLKRDPKTPLKDEEENVGNESWAIELWWERNFYPNINIIANDLHKRGLLEAGKYIINIDW